MKKKPKITLYFDPTEPKIDESIFHRSRGEFLDIYRDAKE
jgi:hypothetical protein